MSTELRPARPEDKSFLAEIVMLAARSHCEVGLWDLLIDTQDSDRLQAIEAALVTEQPSWCHWSNFLIAEVDGQPAAALSGYAAYDDSLMPMEQVLVHAVNAIGYEGEQVGEAMKRTLVFIPCHTPDIEGAWVIEWVATLADFRRRGLVRDLLLAMLERGRERGYHKAQIGVLVGNVSAQRAYENVGFVLQTELTSPEFEAAIGSPGLAQLVIDDLA